MSCGTEGSYGPKATGSFDIDIIALLDGTKQYGYDCPVILGAGLSRPAWAEQHHGQNSIMAHNDERGLVHSLAMTLRLVILHYTAMQTGDCH